MRRIVASRANGARSRGPSTPQGKQRSAANATTHGLLARCVVLKGESRDAFQAALDRYVERFQPVDEIELALVEEMAGAVWRLRRGWAIETRLFDNAMDAQSSGDCLDRMAAAFSDMASRPPLGLMHRYETRLHTMFQRALHNLLVLRQNAGIPNEPNPISGLPAELLTAKSGVPASASSPSEADGTDPDQPRCDDSPADPEESLAPDAGSAGRNLPPRRTQSPAFDDPGSIHPFRAGPNVVLTE